MVVGLALLRDVLQSVTLLRPIPDGETAVLHSSAELYGGSGSSFTRIPCVLTRIPGLSLGSVASHYN
jgi:hypothetical protein